MDKVGVAVGLATISVVLAAVVFPAESALTGPMQFIERHLGFSPDGGDGSMEILVVVVLVAIITVVGVRLATELNRALRGATDGADELQRYASPRFNAEFIRTNATQSYSNGKLQLGTGVSVK